MPKSRGYQKNGDLYTDRRVSLNVRTGTLGCPCGLRCEGVSSRNGDFLAFTALSVLFENRGDEALKHFDVHCDSGFAHGG